MGFFGDYAAAYATFRWLCFRLCSIFRGYICPKKAIMLLHMLLFGTYAIYYALILGSNMLPRGDCATAVWSFPAYLLWFLVVTSYFSFMNRNSTLRTAVVSWCSVVCTAVLLTADCSLLVPPTVFSVLCVGVCASCFFVSFVLSDCRC